MAEAAYGLAGLNRVAGPEAAVGAGTAGCSDCAENTPRAEGSSAVSPLEHGDLGLWVWGSGRRAAPREMLIAAKGSFPLTILQDGWFTALAFAERKGACRHPQGSQQRAGRATTARRERGDEAWQPRPWILSCFSGLHPRDPSSNLETRGGKGTA